MAGGPPAPATRHAHPGLTALLGAACCLVAAYAAWTGLGLGGDVLGGVVTYGGEVAVTAAVVVAAPLRALRSSGTARSGWLLMAVAYVGFLVGDGIDAGYALLLRSAPPFPSVADAGEAFGIVMLVPVLFLIGGRVHGSSRLRLLLDGGITASALLLVSWLTVLRTLDVTLSLAYPISDVVLTVVAFSILSRSRLNPPLLLVALGIVGGAFGDSAFAYLSTFGLARTAYVVETGYFASGVFIALATLLPTPPAAASGGGSPRRWQIVLPYVPLAPATALVLTDLMRGRRLDLFTAAILTVLIALVLVRQFMAVNESQSLSARLNTTLAALRHTAAEREALVEEAPVGICRLDRDGRLVAANQTFVDMLGYPMDEVLGRPFTHLLPPEARAGDQAAYEALASGRSNRLNIEGRFLRKDGTTVWCSQVATVIRDGLGRPESFISIVEDVSERRQQAELAAQIQGGLLPNAAPEIGGYDLAGVCLPADNVAGDFYDWQPGDGLLDLTVADVMGKGVAAALVMAVLRTALRSYPSAAGPAERVGAAAASMSLGVQGLFVTLFHGRLDTTTGELRYVDAGHGYCAILRADGRVAHLPARSLPLGVLDEEIYCEGTARLDPGDALILYSDGLVERDDATASLTDLAGRLSDAPDAAAAVRLLLEAMPGPSTDDVTVVVLRRTAPVHAAAAAAGRMDQG